MRKRLRQLIGVATSAVLASMLLVSTASAATVAVSGNTAAGENQPGWMFNRDVSTATPYAFDTQQASIGTGSLHVLPIGANASDKMIAENFLLTPIADVTSISYDFRIGTGGVDTQEEQFYMNVYANFGSSSPTKFYDCRYNIVPSVGSTSAFTTVTFDPTQNYPVTTRGGADPSPFACPASPAGMNGLSAGSTIRVFALNVGDTSASDVGLDGYLDNVIVSTTAGSTTYDFEPTPPPYPTTGKIKSPREGRFVRGTITLRAYYDDGDEVNDDAVNWAVRADTCDAGVGTVLGNVDGHTDPYNWNGRRFTADFNTKLVDPGMYCFVFNPTDDPGQNDVRETRIFYVAPRNKGDCQNGHWQDYGDNFSNQGQCMKFLEKHHKYGHSNHIKWWKYWWFN